MRTLLTPLLLILCVLTSWADEFETDVPPKFTFRETYIDEVVTIDRENDEYEVVAATSIKVTAVCSMKGVNLSEIDENTIVSIDFEGLVESWFLSEDPTYTKGKKSAKIPLYGFDYVSGEELQIGQVSVSWNSKTVTIIITADNDPDSYQIMGQDRAYDGEDTDEYVDFTTVSLGFADRELTGRTVYVTGSIKSGEVTRPLEDDEQTFETVAVRLNGSIDSDPPKIQLLKPSAGAEINNPDYQIEGTVTDDHEVASLFVQFNDEPEVEVFVDATGKWTAPASFVPGENIINVRAVDEDGNQGTLKPRKITFLLASNLIVRADGSAAGKVSSDIFNTISYFPGQLSPERIVLRNEEKKTVVKATPAADALFKEWTSNYPLTNPTSPKLIFKMQRDMEVTAHFVPNIFFPVKGSYSGMVGSENPMGRGGFNLKLAAAGSFSGTIKLGKHTVRLKGTFDSDGTFAGVVKAGGQKYEVTLSLAQSEGGSDQIIGTFRPQVAEGAPLPFESTIASDRSAYSKKAKLSAELIGAYNALIVAAPGNEDSNFPKGHGFAQVSVSKFGVGRFVGKLGDGTSFSTSAKMSSDNVMSLYVPLYKKKGSIAGRVQIDLSDEDSDIEGTLSWYRPTTGSSGSAFGFAGDCRLQGVKYVKPASDQRLFLNPDGAGEVVIEAPAEGSLPVLELQSGVTLSTANQLVVSDPSFGLSVSFNTRKGTFKGKFSDAAGTKPVKFSGLVLPGTGSKGDVAAGWFKRGKTTGGIQITPPSVPVP